MEKIKDGIYTYSEWVVNDINKIHELKALLVDEKNQQKRDDIYSEIEKEENTLREIIYSFPVSRVKDKCADYSHIVTGKQIGRASCRERVSSPV